MPQELEYYLTRCSSPCPHCTIKLTHTVNESIVLCRFIWPFARFDLQVIRQPQETGSSITPISHCANIIPAINSFRQDLYLLDFI